jgi:hypothetical protein
MLQCKTIIATTEIRQVKGDTSHLVVYRAEENILDERKE